MSVTASGDSSRMQKECRLSMQKCKNAGVQECARCYAKLTSMQIQTPTGTSCRFWPTAAIVVLLSGVAAAQQKTLTIGDIYDPSTRENFSGNVPADVAWIDGTHYAVPRNGAGGVAWVSVDAASGSERPVYDAARMEAALARLPGVGADERAG